MGTFRRAGPGRWVEDRSEHPVTILVIARFADRLNHLCRLAVREVKGEETIEPGWSAGVSVVAIE
jgi:hypothetical protein